MVRWSHQLLIDEFCQQGLSEIQLLRGPVNLSSPDSLRWLVGVPSSALKCIGDQKTYRHFDFCEEYQPSVWGGKGLRYSGPMHHECPRLESGAFVF